MGVHVGEVSVEEGDYYGTPVVVAERLCKAASGGQILTSDALRVVVGVRGHVFRRLGELELKGVDEPVAACEVVWEPAGAEPLPLPSALSIGEGTPFVGRDGEIDRIRASWEGAGGRRHLVLLAGEPGIGKTRLAREFSAAEHATGKTVLFGRCNEEPLTPYQPFVEALGHYVDASSPDELRAQLNERSGHLVALIPHLPERVSDLTPRSPADPEGERYLLFEAVADLLAAGSAVTPIVLVLDDLHWADKPTLLLLRHILRRREAAKLLVIGTYRETELARTHPLAETLADLRRDLAFDRLQLRGLDQDQITALLTALAQHDVGGRGKALAQALERTTEGNPFFIQEIIRHLVETELIFPRDGVWTFDVDVHELGIPEGVKEVIGRRLSRLSESTNVALAHAAVFGREFEFEILRDMTAMPENALLRSLDEALAGQLVEQARNSTDPAYMFSHALVRQTLYEELSIPRRQRLHLRAAEAIEAVRERDIEPYIAQLAVHYRTAGAAAEPKKAIEYSIRAGDAARVAFAYEEADSHWRAALELLEEHDSEPLSRAGVLERLGDLMFVSDIDYPKGIEHLERALVLYEEAGEERKAAQMHSRLGRDLTSRVGGQDIPRALEHFRAAEAVLRKGPERASLGYVYTGMASIAVSQSRTDDGLDTSRRGMDIGERLGNEGLWANAATLHAWHLIASGRPTEGVALFDRAWKTSDRLNAMYPAFLGAWLGGLCLVHLADPVAAQEWFQRELDRPRLAQAPGQRMFLARLLSGAYSQAGRLDDARRVIAEATPRSRQVFWWDGDWEAALDEVSLDRESLHQTGERWNEGGRLKGMSRGHEALGNDARAIELLLQALEIFEGQVLADEVDVRSRLALLFARNGRPFESDSHLARCRDILSSTEDWRGLPGFVAAAEAVVSATKGDVSEAEARFSEAIGIFRRFTLPFDEADALHQWGRALAACGEPIAATEKLDAAVDLYRHHGVSDRFVERVNASRPKASRT